MALGIGYTDRFLTEDEARDVFTRGTAQIDADGRKVLVVIPDSTRSGPIPLCFRLLAELLGKRAAKLDFIIALGTHMPMSEEQIQRHVGISAEERDGSYAHIGIFNHNWQEGLVTLGTITAEETRVLSDGLMAEDVAVQINERILGYDHVIVCGPVFPHEVVGFSGGNKYFFPGISGPDMINYTHWLGAVVTNVNIIGRKGTAVRKVVDCAAAMIPVQKWCFSMVVKGHRNLAGLYFGTPEESQGAAADLSAQVNIAYVDHPFHTVVSVMPDIYDDIWTASKGMYKMEPVVADGGTLIIYAPHINEISYTHGKALDRVGYHLRDYFRANMCKYSGESRGVLAHSTLVTGGGTYENGEEKPRIKVVLATGIPEERCKRINLGYMDPKTIDIAALSGREEEGILVVSRAGELLHRLKEQGKGD
ncbi:MAG: lactate racemase domain-containing protein [Anaerolineae bacterium]